MMGALKAEITRLLLAVQFLTRLPLPLSPDFTPEHFAAAARYYPLVGILIGALSTGTFWLSAMLFPPLIALLIAMAVSLLITGAFHEDGLADTFDGIGGGQTAEQSLTIMKDSRIGTYGTVALITTLAIKLAALAALNVETAALALIVGHGLSRYSSVMVIATSTYRRDHGTGKHTAEGASPFTLLISSLTALLCLAGLAITIAPEAALAGGLGLIAGHLAMRAVFERKLGGYTGDTLGAVQQLSELGLYLGLVAWVSF